MLQVESVLFTGAMALCMISMLLYFALLAFKKEGFAKAAAAVQLAGLVLHTAALVLRGIAAGRLPMTNIYEFSSCFAWALSLVSLIFILKFKFPVLGAFSAPIAFLIIGYAAMQSKEVHDLMPALQSGWLGFHVSTAIVSYGSFGVCFVLSLILLFRGRATPGGFWDLHVPAKDKLDQLSYRAACLGLTLLSLTILTGAIWAERAWGSYWSWDPKETWSLVTWLIYAIYLHLRMNKGWRGKTAAIFAVVGFVCVIFTYIGVNTLMTGLHSYK